MRHIGITTLLGLSILTSSVMMGQIPTRNMAPVAHAGWGQTVAPGSVAILNGGGSWDADGAPLKFHWSLAAAPNGSRAVLQGADTVSPRLVPDLPGKYVARLVVNDGKADSAESLVTISTDNTAPVADAGRDRVAAAGSTVQLNGAASTDVDGDMLTYAWSIVSAPEGSAAVLTDPSLVNPILLMDVPGTYVAQLKVNDGRADSEPVTVTITNGETLRPVARAGRSQTVAPGAMVRLDGAAADPQGLPVKLQWALTHKPAGSNATLDDARSASPFFVADVAGTYIAQLVAHNGVAHSSASTVLITSADLAPVADAGAGREVAAGDSVKLDGSGSWSAGGRALQDSWAMLSRPLNSKAVLSSTTGATPSFVPDVPGAYVVQLMVIDEGGLKSAPVTTLIMASALSITTPSLPDAQLGIPYSFVLTAGGGTPPYTWKSAGGRLPAGFSLDPATGTLSGTALTMNAAYLTFMVTDSGAPAQSATAAMSLTIVASGLQITTTSLPTATKGVQYSQTLSATGGMPPYTWSIAAGSLPSGWTLAPTTGLISGIANSTVNNSQVVIRVTDSAATPGSVTWTYIINVVANPLTITTTSLPNGQTGQTYSSTLTASNAVGTLTWQISSGTLPAGLTLNAATGEISGTPQGAVNATPLTVRVSDAVTLQTTTANLTLTITGPSISVTTTSLPNATAGVPYSQALQAAGGTGGLTWKLTGGSLPAGITLGTDGTISGTPTGAGPATFSVSVTDSSSPAQTAQATLSLTVDVGALTITTTSLPTAMVGQPYSSALTATGGIPPYSWSIVTGRLPGGFTFDATGVIGGSPQFTDPANITFRVTDSSSPAKTTSASFNLNILPVSFAILTNSLPDGQAGAPYAMQIQSAGGVGPYSWSVSSGSLPGGVSLNQSTGLLSGTPTATGSSSMTIRVTDSSSPKLVATAGFTLTIAGKTMTITTPALANGTVGTAYSQQLTATGGTGALTWLLTSGTLPAGLTLNTLTGVINGTPTAAAASVPLSFKVSDSSLPALSATANFTMTITLPGGAPTITTTSLVNGTVGAAYSQTLAATGGTLPYAWQLTAGTLPPGLTFSTGGALSGTPTTVASGTPLTFKVTDGNSQSASVTLALTITGTGGGGTLTVVTTSLPPALVGVPYSQQLVATGGTPPYTWSLPSGRLPGGFVLSPDGVISGTANPANQPDGFLDPLLLGFQVTDSSTPTQSVTAQLVFNITKQALQITTTSLPGGSVGVPYSFTMQASGGGSGVYTWAVISGVLPDGLSLNTTTGLISGTPGAAMVRRIIISVTDPAPPPVVFGGSQTTVSASFTLQVQ